MRRYTFSRISRLAVAMTVLAIVTTSMGIAQDVITEDDLDAAYDEGFEDGYAAAIQQAYEAELRAMYEARMELEAASASQDQINQADAALVTSLVTIQEEQIAVYFEALSDLQEQNATYWAALETAVYEVADEIDDSEVVYTYGGVPAYWAPYAGYYLNEAYVPAGSGSYVIPTAPTVINDIDIDEIVRNIHIEDGTVNVNELTAQANQMRQERLARGATQQRRFEQGQGPGNRIGQSDVPPAIGGEAPALGLRGETPVGPPDNVGQGRLGQSAGQGLGTNQGTQAPQLDGRAGGPNPQINTHPTPTPNQGRASSPQRSGGVSGGRRR